MCSTCPPKTSKKKCAKSCAGQQLGYEWVKKDANDCKEVGSVLRAAAGWPFSKKKAEVSFNPDVLHASHLSFVVPPPPRKVCTCVETDFLCPTGVKAKACTKLCAKEGKAASWSKSKLLGPNGDVKCSNV